MHHDLINGMAFVFNSQPRSEWLPVFGYLERCLRLASLENEAVWLAVKLQVSCWSTMLCARDNANLVEKDGLA